MRIALVVMLVAACGSSLPNYEYNKEPDPRNKELVLGVGDVIGINVWDQKDLNTDATIRPDGTITMPLVGDIRAVGETPSSLKDKVKAALANFVKLGAGNEVTIAVKAWRSYRFTINGEVGRPGVYSSEQYVRVSAAIALAGGLTRFARRGDIKLFRTDAKTGDVREIPLDYDLLASGKRFDMDIFVLPGDYLFVP
ncbi:MAG TPA: polysaccharide biosynthesis/export family protein [Kofleriaceae bacterium]|nr:polysaccharide biosynthesis/export family protein [Kofleriaceae bacterium]